MPDAVPAHPKIVDLGTTKPQDIWRQALSTPAVPDQTVTIHPVPSNSTAPKQTAPIYRRSARLAATSTTTNNNDDVTSILIVLTEASLDAFTPRTAQAAIASSESEKWLAAMQREKDCHIKNKTFGEVLREELPAGEKTIPADWVYRIKHRGAPIESEELDDKQYKARVVIRGQFMKQGINYNDTFAPVAKPATLRSLFAIAAKYKCLLYAGDVETAFLTANMDCKVYVKMPPYWGNGNEPVSADATSHQVRLLLKGVPGIPQGSRLFFQTFTDHLIIMGFQTSAADKCLFINPKLKERNALVLWVDDFVFLCQTQRTKDSFIQELRKRFTIHAFEPLQAFLGMEVIRDINACSLQLNQSNTVRVLLERARMDKCNATSTPTITGAVFTKLDCPSDPTTNTLTSEYRSLIALLNFIACWTRPDITFVVNKLCKFMSNPGDIHWKQLKHLIRYMAGTQEWGLTYEMGEENEHAVKGFSDSSFGDCPDTGRSTLAYVFTYHKAILSWYSKLNGYVTLSTNHSEYSALAVAAREAEWLTLLFKDIEPDISISPIPIMVDNSGVVSLVFNPVDHQANKHVKLASHYARELTEQKLILPMKVSTDDNIADMFTKPLSIAAFKKIANQLVKPRVEKVSLLFMRATYENLSPIEEPNEGDSSPDSETDLFRKEAAYYKEQARERNAIAREEYWNARTKQTSRSMKIANRKARTSEIEPPFTQDVRQCMTRASEMELSATQEQEQPAITEEEEAKQIIEEERISTISKLLSQLPPTDALGNIQVRPPHPLLFCINCCIYNSEAYTQLICQNCSGNRFVWSCPCAYAMPPDQKAPNSLNQSKSNAATPQQGKTKRSRIFQAVRSYSTKICYTAPGKRGQLYHKASCMQRPFGGVYGNIEFAYAARMKPATCCFDGENHAQAV